MVDKDKVKLCAQNIAKSIHMVEKGENVFIRGGLYSQELLEEIGLCIYRNGGVPFISYTSDNYVNTIYQDPSIDVKTIESTPQHYLNLIKNIDAYIVIEPLEDPSVNANAPRKKVDAVQKSRTAIREVLYGFKDEYAPGKKWCYAAWPSKKAAEYFNIDYELYEKFIVDGMSIPSEKMNEITAHLGKFFDNAKKVYVSDDNGTDFWVSIENRKKILDDGIISDEQIEQGDLGGNLPAGEVFFPPQEKLGEGRLFCPLTKDRISDKIIKNVDLSFKDGKLEMDKVSADTNLEDLIASFKHCEELDKKSEVPEIRTYNVAELGIGCNPEITKAIGYILTDEKINGSVHLAFGFNNSFGGTSKSQMHWDFVTAPKANITVEYLDGTRKQIMQQGSLIS
ncbi:MAG: aminopeptidase [Promethearchaeota archaeon]|nr:MAG: aminopeptidase [Candidatus Lokiarchaeota archaeon]